MKDAVYLFRSIRPMSLATFLVLSTILVWSAPSHGLHTSSGFDPFRYLPPGSKIRNREKDVIFADLFGDGAKEAIIFYTVGESNNDHKAGVLVLRPKGSAYERFWEKSIEGSWGFDAPTGVYDLNKSGLPQIVAYATVGASCPGILAIYEYSKGALRRIFGDDNHCQSVEIKDLDGDGVPEIIVRIRIYGVNKDIYRWNGRRYVLSNSRFPQYFNADLEQLLGPSKSSRTMPTSGRLQVATQIISIFIIQRRFREAVSFCRELLEAIQNPALSTPDLPHDEAAATVYRLLGDTYKAQGNRPKARRYYDRADQLTRSKS